VVCREDGVSDFDKPRAAVGRLGSRDAFLYAFDLLEIDGENLRRCEWQVRRATLRSLLKKSNPGIQLSEHLEGAGRRRGVSPCVRDGARRHRLEAAGPAVSIWALAGLDQGQEPERPCRDAHHRIG
jgi:hypothetical protein